MLSAVIAFVVLMRRVLMPRDDDPEGRQQDRLSLQDLIDSYDLGDRLRCIRVGTGSPLVGATVGQALLRTRFGVTVVGIERKRQGKTEIRPALIHTVYEPDDVIYVVGAQAEIDNMIESLANLQPVVLTASRQKIVARELGLAEVLLTPRSELIGHTIKEARFRERNGLSVLAILRKGQPSPTDFLNTRLEFGDSLLVGGGWRQIDLLQSNQRHFSVLTLPREMDEVAPYRRRAPRALAIVAAMLVMMTFTIVPTVTAVLIAALAMVLTRCVTMEGAYKAINWQSVVLIAGMLPMATALDKTGALELIVKGLVSGIGDLGPMVLMAGLFLLTSVFSQFISNTATTVLVAPIAVGTAISMGVSPYPLLMTVALAASTAFSTPMASPVNTLVLGPGSYRFNDFVKLGVPLQLLAMAITLLMVPRLFPF